MNINQLECFFLFVRQGSFSKAATALHLTQPSISKMIQSLEDELCATLFIRSAKPVELTDAGSIILKEAEEIVTRFRNLSLELDDIVHLKKGKVRIGLPPISGSTVIPRILGEFNARYPGIQLQLSEYGSKKIQTELQAGSLDVGIVCCLPLLNDNFASLPLIREPLKVIVHPRHSLANESLIDFAALAGESFILYSEDFSLHDSIVNRCKLAGFQPRILCETSQQAFMTELVAARRGIALLPSGICDRLDPASIVSIPFRDPQIYLHLNIIWRQDRYISFATRRWLDFTAAEFPVTPLGDPDQSEIGRELSACGECNDL